MMGYSEPLDEASVRGIEVGLCPSSRRHIL